MTASGTLRAGWRTLVKDPDRILVPTIALSIPAIALHVLLQHLTGIWVAGSQECGRRFGGATLVAQCGPSNGRAQLALLVGLFTFFLVGNLVVAGLYRAVLDAADERPGRRGPLAGWSLARVLPAALLLSVVLTVGTLFLLLPGILLGFFTRYTMLFVVDRDLGPVAAIAASFELTATRIGSELWFVVRAVPLLLLGVLVLGVGTFVAVPVVLTAQALRYRAATGVPDAGIGTGVGASQVG